MTKTSWLSRENLLGVGGGGSWGVNENPDFNPLSGAEKSVLICATFSVMTTTLGAHCAIDLPDWKSFHKKETFFTFQLSIFNPLLFNVVSL